LSLLVVFLLPEASFQRSPGTLGRRTGELFAVLVDVDQREGGAQVIVVFLQAAEREAKRPVSDLGGFHRYPETCPSF